MISTDFQSDIKPLARHASLKMLGLRQWYSRYHLPNACSTPDILQIQPGCVEVSLPQLAQGRLISNEKVSIKSPVMGGGKLILDSVVEQLNEKDQEDCLVDVPSLLINSQTADRAVDLSLCMVLVDGALVFYERESAVHHEVEHSFLRSFLKFAVGSKKEGFEFSFFEWPVFSGSVLKGAQLAHFDVVFTRWVCSVDWSAINRIFYFGYHFELLEQALLDIRIARESECVFVPVRVRLAEILGAPVKKRGLWESISRLSGL